MYNFYDMKKCEHLNKNCREIVENVCPYCKEVLIMNKKSFANHVRWCKQNPRYEEIKSNTITKLKNNKHDILNYECKCENCGELYIVNCTENNFLKGKYRKTCSDECAKELTYKHSDIELKYKKVSETLLKRYEQTVHKRINHKFCIYCGKEIIKDKKSYTKYCCEQCKRNDRFERQNKNKSEKVLYRKMCSFKFSLNDFPEEYNFDLIKKNGWYKAKNRGDNLYGISRDHIISVKYGFEHNIDPYIISHPANCQLLIHTDNESKNSKCDMSIEELVEKINKWHEKYGVYENKICYLDMKFNYKYNL